MDHHPDLHGPLVGPCEVVCLPTYYGEVVDSGVVTCCTGMVIEGERGLKIFPEPFTKGPHTYPYLFLITLQSITPLPVEYSTFLCNVVTVLWATRRFVMVLSTLK